jgi:hypothetical protein
MRGRLNAHTAKGKDGYAITEYYVLGMKTVHTVAGMAHENVLSVGVQVGLRIICCISLGNELVLLIHYTLILRYSKNATVRQKVDI